MQDDPIHLAARRRFTRSLLKAGVLPCLSASLSGAWGSSPPRELRVISGPDSPAGRQMLLLLRQRWPGLLAEADPAAFEGRKGAAIHLALGAGALQKALQGGLKGPLLCTMASSQAYRQVMGAEGGREGVTVSGVFAETSPAAQMQLIQAIFGHRTVVGCLLSEASAPLEKSLLQTASQAGIELVVERVAQGADPVRALTRLRDARVLLAVPDNALYTPDSLRAILESTYRRALPVIGFSAATVAAGTLATTYCAIDDMVADVADLLDETGAGGPWPEARFPRYWRVAVNDSVARSLGIPVDDKARQLGKTPRRNIG